MGAKRKPLETVSAADLGLDTGRVGGDGARSVVRTISPPPPKAEGLKIEDSGGDSAGKVIAFLSEKGLI